MSENLCLATIRHPSANEINVRSGPGTNHDVVFKGTVGLGSLQVMDAEVDNEGRNLNGKVYQWFHLTFPDGRTGWIRDDLLDIQGGCTRYGYDDYPQPAYAFGHQRREVMQKTSSETGEIHEPATPPPVQPIIPPPAPKSATIQDVDRIQKAAFAVTGAFEGSGYAAYNNYDAGIISYGIIQFTLASGTLFAVVDQYLRTAVSSTAGELRNYHERIRSRDGSLRYDENLKRLLLAAASEPEMRVAQDTLMAQNYWDRLIDGYVKPRGFRLPLTYALLFDIGVNFGVGDGFVRMAEKEFGVPARSNVATHDVTEEKIIAKVAELRRISHYKQAERDNLPGLKVRGDFWVKLVNQGDWEFKGDPEGNIVVNGRKVQIANP